MKRGEHLESEFVAFHKILLEKQFEAGKQSRMGRTIDVPDCFLS